MANGSNPRTKASRKFAYLLQLAAKSFDCSYLGREEMEQINKYPRTHHIEGSRLQPGDEDLDSIPFAAIKQQYLVVEEKVDGANAAISFSADGQQISVAAATTLFSRLGSRLLRSTIPKGLAIASFADLAGDFSSGI